MQEEPGFAPQSRSRFKPPKDQSSPNVQGTSETRAGKRTRRRPVLPEVGRGEINSAIRVSERVSTGRRFSLLRNLFTKNTATVADFSSAGVGSTGREDGRSMLAQLSQRQSSHCAASGGDFSEHYQVQWLRNTP